jgi:uncharacterized protein (TIGR02284 family)
MADASTRDIEILNSLVTTTIDSANGFERSAENVHDGSLRSMFEDFARERREVVSRLQSQVSALGGTPNDDGSLKADLHRRFEDLRQAIGGGTKAVVEEVERGEDYIKAKYETAMRDDSLGAETRALLAQCFESVRAGHDRASALKHSMQDGGDSATASAYQDSVGLDRDASASSAGGPAI